MKLRIELYDKLFLIYLFLEWKTLSLYKKYDIIMFLYTKLISIPPFDGLEEFSIQNSSMEEKILSKILQTVKWRYAY